MNSCSFAKYLTVLMEIVNVLMDNHDPMGRRQTDPTDCGDIETAKGKDIET